MIELTAMKGAVSVLVAVLAVGFASVMAPVWLPFLMPTGGAAGAALISFSEVMATFSNAVLLRPAWWVAAALTAVALGMVRGEKPAE